MKVLSLTQPWATLVAIGAKRIETRSWSTRYRGPLAIHAAKHMPDAAKDLLFTEPFVSALIAAGFTPMGLMLATVNKHNGYGFMPRGAIVAVCNLVDCQEIGVIGDYTPEPERSFGDYTPGRFAWHLTDVRRLPEPIPYRGHQGLRDMLPEVLQRVRGPQVEG